MLTERLAGFVCGTRKVPAQVLDSVKIAMMDTLGVALAGSREPAMRIALDYVREIGAQPQAAVWGHECATSHRGCGLCQCDRRLCAGFRRYAGFFARSSERDDGPRRSRNWRNAGRGAGRCPDCVRAGPGGRGQAR